MAGRPDGFIQSAYEFLQNMGASVDDAIEKVQDKFRNAAGKVRRDKKIDTEQDMELSPAHSSIFSRWKKKLQYRLRPSKYATSIDTGKVSETSNPYLPHESDISATPAQWMRNEVLRLVQQESNEISQSLPHETSERIKYLSAPLAPLIGRKRMGKRIKLGITVDDELHKLLNTLSSQLGVSVSQLVDNALWDYLGQPELSFQKRSENTDEKEE
jgi:predicted DNA-binding protein